MLNKIPFQNVVTWNAILGGCAMHRLGEDALKHFEYMCEEHVQQDDTMFIHLLLACSHLGLVDEGMCFYMFQ